MTSPTRDRSSQITRSNNVPKATRGPARLRSIVRGGVETSASFDARSAPLPYPAGLSRMLKNPFFRRLLKKVHMQGGARCAGTHRRWVGGVLGPYVAARPLPPRQRGEMSERANAPPAAAEAAGSDDGPLSAAC